MDRNQITELFKYRRTALALECLYTDGPMRWTDLGHAMSRRGGEWVEGKAVTRPLHALQRLGLVASIDGDGGSSGNHLYALTPVGVELSRQIQGLGQLDGRQDDGHHDEQQPDEPD